MFRFILIITIVDQKLFCVKIICIAVGRTDPTSAMKIIIYEDASFKFSFIVLSYSNTPRMPVSILVADDHAVVRQGIALSIKELKSDALIHQASDYKSLMSVVESVPLELAICDINMPGCEGFHVVKDIRAVQQDLKILIFSFYREDLYAPRYLHAGANGYLRKDSENEEIKKAIRSMLETGSYISKATKERMAVQDKGELENISPLQILSTREIEVAKLLTEGLGLLEISNKLDLHVATVSTYKRRIYEKMKITNLSELITTFQNYSDQNS